MKHFLNSRGNSLIQVLVSIGLTALLAATVASVLSHQSKEARALNEQLAAADLQKLLISTLADGSVCKYVLNNPNPQTFNSTIASKINPQNMTVSKLYTNTAGTTTTAEVGKQASGYSNTLFVKNIRLQIDSGHDSNWSGQWLVEFDETKTVRPLKPLSISTTILADISSPSAAKILNCMPTAVGTMQEGIVNIPIFCHAGNNSENTCTINIEEDPQVIALGLKAPDLKLIGFSITQHGFDGCGSKTINTCTCVLSRTFNSSNSLAAVWNVGGSIFGPQTYGGGLADSTMMGSRYIHLRVSQQAIGLNLSFFYGDLTTAKLSALNQSYAAAEKSVALEPPAYKTNYGGGIRLALCDLKTPNP
ncbi:PulJ/GspJ family protein [Bdellovibrio bacteriovorus]|nr:hypothetical protein [Bdellovibrio bacteriovorus]